MHGIYTGADFLEHYTQLCREESDPALRAAKYGSVLQEIVASEERLRIKQQKQQHKSPPSRDIDRVLALWMTGYIARGGNIRHVEKTDPEYIFHSSSGNYRFALPGQIIAPAFGAMAMHYFVMSGHRERISILDGTSHQTFYYLDDFSIGSFSPFVTLPYSVARDIIGPVAPKRFWDFLIRPESFFSTCPSTPEARVLIKAGVDLDVMKACIQTGKNAHLIKATRPLPVNNRDLIQLRAKAWTVFAKTQPTLCQLCPDGIQLVLPLEVVHDKLAVSRVFMRVLDNAKEEPRAIARTLLTEALEHYGHQLFRVPEIPSKPGSMPSLKAGAVQPV